LQFTQTCAPRRHVFSYLRLMQVCFTCRILGSEPDMMTWTRWMIGHPRLVIVAWVALAAGLLGLSQGVGNRAANNFGLPNTDSQHAVDLLQTRFPAQARRRGPDRVPCA